MGTATRAGERWSPFTGAQLERLGRGGEIGRPGETRLGAKPTWRCPVVKEAEALSTASNGSYIAAVA